jgi:hypothetical protein
MPVNLLPTWLTELFGPGGRAGGSTPPAQRVANQAARSPLETRLVRLKSAVNRSAQGDRAAALELCATLGNGKELLSLRTAAALGLGGAAGVPEAPPCLSSVALSRSEPAPLRGASMLSLASIGGAEARKTIWTILLSREAEGVTVNLQDLGGDSSLQKFAALLLFDFEKLEGRELLDRLARDPGTYLSPWAEAMAVVFHSDTPRYLQAMLDVLWDARRAEQVRLAVVEAYAMLLSNPGMPIDRPDPWWDSLAGIAAAKNTESPRIRDAAAGWLKKLRPKR